MTVSSLNVFFKPLLKNLRKGPKDMTVSSLDECLTLVDNGRPSAARDDRVYCIQLAYKFIGCDYAIIRVLYHLFI